MTKDFCFVDGSPTDRTKRKLIRSHVMKGKNAGRTVHRPSKLGIVRLSLYNHKCTYRNAYALKDQKLERQQRRMSSTAITRNMGNLFETFSYPFTLKPCSVKVINQFFIYVTEKMYPPRLGLSIEKANTSWLMLLLTDEAASHCTIALMEACSSFFFGCGNSSPEALQHLSKTFTLVQERLASDEALSDSTLGIILMLIAQEQIRHEQREAEIHFEGLKRMIELRGGLSQLESNVPLLLKICKTDITFCLQYDRPLSFFRDRMSDIRLTLASKGICLGRPNSIPTTRHTSLNLDLHEILLDVMSVTFLYNSNPSGIALEMSELLEIVVSILSRLIRLHPLRCQSPQENIDIDYAYHIGLIIYMMTLFIQHDKRRIVRYDLVSSRLQDVLDRGRERLDDGLVLWLMILGALWTSDDTDGAWLIGRLRELLIRIGVTSWGEVQESIGEFPWIGAIHDQPGCAVWDLVCRGNETS